MNSTAWVYFMVLVALMATSNSGCTLQPTRSVPLSSVCVFDETGVCWINRAGGQARVIQKGDYGISPDDMNRILEKLKAVQ